MDAPLIINPFDDEHFMREALRQARKAAKQDEVIVLPRLDAELPLSAIYDDIELLGEEADEAVDG